MRILVVGAGATGGYFGGRLAEAGRDVTFLVRPKRAEQLQARGLQLVSPHGDVTLAPKIALAASLAAPFDLVLLTVKGFALEAALADIAPAVGGETMIFPVLNGMHHVERLVERFGERAVLGGVCLVATTLDAQGRIVQLAGMQELIFGERAGGTSPRIVALDGVLQGAGFKARASSAVMQEMWDKWVFLATLGGITCLMRGTIGDIAAAAGGAEHARQLFAECAAISKAAGYPQSEKFLQTRAAVLSESNSGLASSMYRDMTQGLPVEVDQILGDLLNRARALGVPTPLLSVAFTHLRVYQTGLERR